MSYGLTIMSIWENIHAVINQGGAKVPGKFYSTPGGKFKGLFQNRRFLHLKESVVMVPTE
jgi:hypothetical protein